MAIFVLFSVLSPRRRLYEPEAADFRLRHTDVRLPVTLRGDRNPLCGLATWQGFDRTSDKNKNCSFLNCNTYPVFIETEMIVRFYMSPWMFLNIT